MTAVQYSASPVLSRPASQLTYSRKGVAGGRSGARPARNASYAANRSRMTFWNDQPSWNM